MSTGVILPLHYGKQKVKTWKRVTTQPTTVWNTGDWEHYRSPWYCHWTHSILSRQDVTNSGSSDMRSHERCSIQTSTMEGILCTFKQTRENRQENRKKFDYKKHHRYKLGICLWETNSKRGWEIPAGMLYNSAQHHYYPYYFGLLSAFETVWRLQLS